MAEIGKVSNTLAKLLQLLVNTLLLIDQLFFQHKTHLVLVISA